MLAFIGIGGETFKKAPPDATTPKARTEHWLHRVTRRGWIAIACYLLVFGFTLAENTLEVQRADRHLQEDVADQLREATARQMDRNTMQRLLLLTTKLETVARLQLGDADEGGGSRHRRRRAPRQRRAGRARRPRTRRLLSSGSTSWTSSGTSCIRNGRSSRCNSKRSRRGSRRSGRARGSDGTRALTGAGARRC
jgi:hypothetical protein